MKPDSSPRAFSSSPPRPSPPAHHPEALEHRSARSALRLLPGGGPTAGSTTSSGPIILPDEKDFFLLLSQPHEREIFKEEFWKRRERDGLVFPLGRVTATGARSSSARRRQKYDGRREDAGRMVIVHGEPASHQRAARGLPGHVPGPRRSGPTGDRPAGGSGDAAILLLPTLAASAEEALGRCRFQSAMSFSLAPAGRTSISSMSIALPRREPRLVQFADRCPAADQLQERMRDPENLPRHQDAPGHGDGRPGKNPRRSSRHPPSTWRTSRPSPARFPSVRNPQARPIGAAAAAASPALVSDTIFSTSSRPRKSGSESSPSRRSTGSGFTSPGPSSSERSSPVSCRCPTPARTISSASFWKRRSSNDGGMSDLTYPPPAEGHSIRRWRRHGRRSRRGRDVGRERWSRRQRSSRFRRRPRIPERAE